MSELFANAAEIMLVGMAAVLAFLLMLILAMTVMGRLIPTPKPVPQATPSAPQGSSGSDDQVPSSVIAAISAAVHRYRQSKD